MPKCIGSSSLGTPPETYLYALEPSTDSLLAAIGSDDVLRIFDAKTLQISKTTRCHNGVACLTSDGRSHFVTGGRDGVIRCWDGRAHKRAELVEPRSNGISAVACKDHYIAAGTESTKEGLGDVSVLLFDSRNPSTPVRQYIESHTDTVTQLAFHPSQPNALLSGSTDGLVSLFDVNQEDEEDALQQVLNPRSAVHCAGFLANDQVYVVSTDEQFSIHSLAKTGAEDEQVPPPLEFGDVREQLQCQYVVNVIVQSDGPVLMAHGNAQKQTLSLSSIGSPGAWGFGQRIDLPGAHGEEVIRDVKLIGGHAFSCGEDGNVKVWSL